MAFRNVLLSTFCYHLDGDGSDREDCRGGIKLSHFWANSLAISWILATAAVAALLAALWAARAASRLRTLSNASCVVPIPGALRLRTFKRGCPRFHDALLLTPKARRNGLRLLTGEHQSALYVTALQTLQRVVLEAGDRHGAGLHHLRHIHFCRAH